MARTRFIRSIVAGVTSSGLLIVALAVWRFGVADSKARVTAALDDWHIVGERTSLFRRTSALGKANASRDAEVAMRNGDKRLLGFSLALEGPLVVPGVPPEALAGSRKELGVRALFVGCVAVPEFEDYRKATERYAGAYNATLLRLVAIKRGAA